LGVIRARLAPHGVAFVSHNIKPGYHVKAMAREMMLFATRGVTAPAQRARQARSFLELLVGGAREEDRLYLAPMPDQLQEKLPLPDEVLLHDDLGDICDGCWFHELAARLEAHGLQYLADTRIASNFAAGLGDDVRALLRRAKSVVEREQYLDFFT